MFNAKHFALSFAALAACTAEPTTELAPQQSAEALAAAKSIGILPAIAPSSSWTVYAQPMGASDGSMEDNLAEKPEADDPVVEDHTAGPSEPEDEGTPSEPEEYETDAGIADGEEIVRLDLEGDYTMAVSYIEQAESTLEIGTDGIMSFTGSTDTFMADGFVEMRRGGELDSINHFAGKGSVTLLSDEGCEVEWAREVTGKMDTDGTGFLFIVDEATMVGDCGGPTLHTDGVFNVYEVELAPVEE